MTAGDQKYRIALAAFETADALVPAVEALQADGVELSRIGLILSASFSDQISRAFGRLGQGGEYSRIADDLMPVGDGGAPVILASASLIAPWLRGLRAPALWKNDPGQERAPRLAADLEHQVLSGAVLLGVGSTTPRDQWLCTRVLLEQSSAPVLALECSPTPAGTETDDEGG